MMTASVTAALRKALRQLENDRKDIDGKIAGIRSLLSGTGGRTRSTDLHRAIPRRTTKRRRMSVAARRAVSQRMKAYWAARKGAQVKAKAKKA